MAEALTIAHLTDVHLGPIAGFGPRHWTLKRLLGYANWLRHRRGAYRRDVLDRLVADVRRQAPDHIVVPAISQDRGGLRTRGWTATAVRFTHGSGQ